MCTCLSSASATPERRLERASGQAGLPNSTSYAQKSLHWPAGGGTLDFDYFVDSEENWDFLRVFVDGSAAYSWSGPSKSGHITRAMTGGAHLIRFEYSKDGSVDRGLDTATIASIVARDALGVLRRFHFDDRAGGLQGWTVGGTGGGFSALALGSDRSIRRPTSQAFAGYVATPTNSRAERTFTFGGTGSHAIEFDYSIDSEPNYDFLRIFIDGALTWQVSGQAHGSMAVPVAAGTHLVAFEYYKDTSVDVGRDIAIIDNVRATNDRTPFEIHSFDGRALGALPYGWAGSGSAGSFVALRAV